MINLKPIWTKSKWQKSEIEGKSVEFRLTSGATETRGVGKFVVGGPNPKGLLFVQIELILPGRHHTELLQVRYYLPQGYVDLIQKHPDSTIADFLVS